MKARSVERLQSQTELVLDQIANRLQHRIKDSVISRINDGNILHYVPLPNADATYQILEWIGKDNDGFLGENGLPGWSGFVDLDSANTNRAAVPPRISTPGSRLDFAENTINALSDGAVSLNAGAQSPALIFKGKSSYDIAQYGWSGVDGNYTHAVQLNGVDVLEFIEPTANVDINEIYEQYNLAWSAYAIVPVGGADDFNLTLVYNYQPWENETFNDGTTSILAEHVSTFRFTQIGDTIRLKLCISDANRSNFNTATDSDFSFCKEKVVY